MADARSVKIGEISYTDGNRTKTADVTDDADDARSDIPDENPTSSK